MLLVREEWLDRETLSTALGVASIGSWLCAQLPQLYENYRNSSVEGLAFPFLVSWLFGDATNLIGCVLTHQLPFQTYLASYFVMVDVVLLSQYIYYYRRQATHELPPLSSNYPHVHGVHPSHHRSMSDSWISSPHNLRFSRKRSAVKGGGVVGVAGVASSSSTRNQNYKRRTAGDGEGEDVMAQSWMSESSAQSPAVGSKQRNRSIPPPQTSQTPLSSSSSFPISTSSRSLAFTPDSTDSITQQQEQSRGRSLHRPQFTLKGATMLAPGEYGGLETISGSPASGSALEAFLIQQNAAMAHLGGGTRDPQYSTQDQAGISFPREPRRKTSSRSTSRPATLRRSTTMTFLSVGLLFTFGKWCSMTGESGTGTVRLSRAWLSDSPIPHQSRAISPMVPDPTLLKEYSSQSSLGLRFVHPRKFSKQKPNRRHRRQAKFAEGNNSVPKRDWERFFGRASAWICTSLYLTSRLPQIWQNFRRRSVEGLSMLLFVFAAIGNTLYVLSIMTNPMSTEPGYLLESLPYLLGSGGTLCFDFTIVLQSYLYSETRKERKERERRRQSSGMMDAEEAAGLLASQDDDDEQIGNESALDSENDTAGRHRSRSSSATGRLRRSTSRSTRALKRSNSTKLPTRRHASLSSTRSASSVDGYNALEDREFDFAVDIDSQSRSRTRTTSGATSGTISTASQEIHPIPEEGESNLTLRS